MTRRHTADALVLYAAVATIVLLTAVSFWLSYAHLHDTADANGLPGARGWGWPSCTDLFIAAGELLMLRAALRREKDPWAVTLTLFGSLVSVALNVAGVPDHSRPLVYVVAAVPPTAALLAFGALMRQVYSLLAQRADEEFETQRVALLQELRRRDAVDAEATQPTGIPPVGVPLSDAELDMVLTVLRSETDPPRSMRDAERRFRELGYVASAARFREAWARVAAEKEVEAL